jgi:hypothetical protein
LVGTGQDGWGESIAYSQPSTRKGRREPRLIIIIIIRNKNKQKNREMIMERDDSDDDDNDVMRSIYEFR